MVPLERPADCVCRLLVLGANLCCRRCRAHGSKPGEHSLAVSSDLDCVLGNSLFCGFENPTGLCGWTGHNCGGGLGRLAVREIHPSGTGRQSCPLHRNRRRIWNHHAYERLGDHLAEQQEDYSRNPSRLAAGKRIGAGATGISGLADEFLSLRADAVFYGRQFTLHDIGRIDPPELNKKAGSAGLCNPQSVPLKRDLDPEANGTVAAIEQLRITKAGRQSVQASVEIDERIDSAKGRRGIGSGKVVTVFGWLKTFTMLMCQVTLARSPHLVILETWKLPVLVIASRTWLRRTLPNGVPKTVSASGPLRMYRTWLALTEFTGMEVAPLVMAALY